ncbi:MAG: flagellar basal body P-ring formation chaperone FlgA [Planctomycetota bacterium]
MNMVIRFVIVALLGVLGLSHVVEAGTIRLRASAVAAPGETITLADVAVLRGDAATALADVVLIEAAEASPGSGGVELEMGAIRDILRTHGISLGRMALSGQRCLVRIRSTGALVQRVPEAQPVRPETIDPEAPATVRKRVGELLMRMFDVEAEDIRVRYDTRDQDLLAQTEWGRRIVVRPMTTEGGSRILVDVRVMAGDRTVASGTVRADVEIRRHVVVLEAGVERDALLTSRTVNEVDMWMEPGGGALVSDASEAIGKRARKRLHPGSMLRASDLEEPLAVLRGEIVEVLAINGGIGLQTKARAMRDARVGERIECRMDRSRHTFMARVDGPGRVIVVLDDDAGRGMERANDRRRDG